MISGSLSWSNNLELKQEFRKVHASYGNNPSAYDSSLRQTEFQNTSIYSINTIDKKPKLFIYDTERECEEVRILKTSQLVNVGICMAQLPNGKLFCFGNSNYYGITLLIDMNGDVQQLPSGTPCSSSSAIYFNRNVYCFGGLNTGWSSIAQSSRFDLDKNRWISLPPMPEPDFLCNSIIFNGKILISGYDNTSLALYSIDIGSFSVIPCDECLKMKNKILIKEEESLYMIECPNGSIFESEIANFTIWRWIARSTINISPDQIYCSYNKGTVYIGCNNGAEIAYYRFNLNKKILTALK